MSDLRIWKAIFEVKYPAAATLFDLRGAIAKRWQWTSDLSEWQISNNQVAIHNKPNTTFLRAGFKSTVIVMELPSSYKAFCALAREFSTWTLEKLQVTKAERIGLRLIQVAERRHFKVLVSKMRKKLFRLEETDWEILGGHPEDIGFPLTLNLDEYRANFSLGPMKRDQLADLFESKEVQEKLPPVSLFLDFDLYRHEPDRHLEVSQQLVSTFLKSGGERIQAISTGFIDHFGGFE